MAWSFVGMSGGSWSLHGPSESRGCSEAYRMTFRPTEDGFSWISNRFSWCFWFWCLKLCMLRMFDMFGVYFAQPVMNLRLATELWNWKIWNAGWWSEHSSQHCFSCSCCSTRCQQRIAEKREISLAVSIIYMIFIGSFSIRRSTSRRAFSDGEVLETFGGGRAAHKI